MFNYILYVKVENNLVSPIIHTQPVEKFWGDLKDVVRRRDKKYGTTHLQSHILTKYPENTLHHLMIEAGKLFSHISNS